MQITLSTYTSKSIDQLVMQIYLFDSLIYTHRNEFITTIYNRYTPDLTNSGASSNNSSSSSYMFKPHKLVLDYHLDM